MSAGKAVYGILSTTTAVTDLVSTRIDPQFSPTGIYPRIVFGIDDLEEMQSHDGPTGTMVASVSIEAIARTKIEAQAIVEVVKNLIDNQDGTWGGVVVTYCSYKSPAIEDFLSLEDTGEQDQLVSLTHNYVLWYLGT